MSYRNELEAAVQKIEALTMENYLLRAKLNPLEKPKKKKPKEKKPFGFTKGTYLYFVWVILSIIPSMLLQPFRCLQENPNDSTLRNLALAVTTFIVIAVGLVTLVATTTYLIGGGLGLFTAFTIISFIITMERNDNERPILFFINREKE